MENTFSFKGAGCCTLGSRRENPSTSFLHPHFCWEMRQGQVPEHQGRIVSQQRHLCILFFISLVGMRQGT